MGWDMELSLLEKEQAGFDKLQSLKELSSVTGYVKMAKAPRLRSGEPSVPLWVERSLRMEPTVLQMSLCQTVE